jgi:hypothetical protein
MSQNELNDNSLDPIRADLRQFNSFVWKLGGLSQGTVLGRLKGAGDCPLERVPQPEAA